MFTGIVSAVGRVTVWEPRGADVRLGIDAGKLDLAAVRAGDSISVSGVCLTALDPGGGQFFADVSTETLACTVLRQWRLGERVNLETALTPNTPLGGHLVSGHVDGIAHVVARRADGRSVRFRLRAPDALARYIAAKGSVCLDGVSLTVNMVEGNEFELNVIPHTLAETTLGDWQIGRDVNLEVDLVARYLERLLGGRHTR